LRAASPNALLIIKLRFTTLRKDSTGNFIYLTSSYTAIVLYVELDLGLY
jgi:hypothetical protein